MNHRVWALLATAAVAATPAIGQTPVARSVRITRSPETLVTVYAAAGDVTAHQTDTDEVQVLAYLPDESVRLEAAAGPDRATVLVELKGQAAAGGAPARLEVSVPVWASLNVHSTSGNVTVMASGADTSVEALSREGDVKVTGTARSLAAGTFTGAVIIDGDWGELDARTATGPITISGTAATVATSTLGGLTAASLGRISRAAFDAVSGDLDLRVAFAEPSPTNTLRAETSLGSIRISIPPDGRYLINVQDRAWVGRPNPEQTADGLPRVGASRVTVGDNGRQDTTITLRAPRGDISFLPWGTE